MSDHWEPEPGRPGVLSRLLMPQAGARPATTALVVGVVAVGAFVASLILEWQRVTLTMPSSDSFNVGPGEQFTAVAMPGTVDTLGEVYLIGMMALLGLLAAVLTRADLALRFRMGAIGVGIALIGVIGGVTLRFPASTVAVFGGIFLGRGSGQEELAQSQKVAYEPGVAAAALAVVLTVVAIWLAAVPAVRAVTHAAPAVPAPQYRVEAPTAEPASPVVAQVDELSVSASEPLDLTAARDPWAR